jgi:hypothetical protein
MKLFSVKESTTANDNQVRKEIAQIAHLEVTLKTLQQRINTENDEFSKRLEEQRHLYAQEKMKLQEEIKALTSEVTALERRHEVAMVPVEKLKEDLKKEKREVERIIKRNQEESLSLKNQIHLTEIKLDDICKQEKILEEEQDKLNQKIKEHNIRQNVLEAQEIKYNEMFNAFQNEMTSKTLDFSKRENALEIKAKKLDETMQLHNKEYEDEMAKLEKRKQELEESYKRSFDESFAHFKNEEARVNALLAQKEKEFDDKQKLLIENAESLKKEYAEKEQKLRDERQVLNRIYNEIENKK